MMESPPEPRLTLDEIREHWARSAANAGTDITATTRTSTIKLIEIAAIERALRASDARTREILEVGCGNAHNLIALAEAFPTWTFHGVDLVEEMVEAAEKLIGSKGLSDRVTVEQADVLDLSRFQDSFDVAFTVRCLINLNTIELQKAGIDQLGASVRSGGQVLVLENWMSTYGRQNQAREELGLPSRTPAEFNLFLDDLAVLDHFEEAGFTIEGIDDIGSLHDLLLYVLIPAANGGEVDYEHPLVHAATALTVAIDEPGAPFGGFGQNRLLRTVKFR